MKQILSAKDILISDTIQSLAESIIKSVEETEAYSAEESRDILLKKTEEVLATLPIIFQTKWATPLKQYILQQKNLSSKLEYVTVPKTKTSIIVMAGKFNRAYHSWTSNTDCVSFSMPLEIATKLSTRDLFTLHFYVFSTCIRQYNDGMMGLACTGISSSGKSTLFENPLLSSAYNYCSDKGVGRFHVEDKNSILAHDFDIDNLVFGKDADKFRAISRAEVVKVKIHSSEKNLPAVFLFITANQRITDHVFEDEDKSNIANYFDGNLKQKRKVYYPSQLMPPAGSKRKKKDGSVEAMQFRFIEAFCRKRPYIDARDLPEAGTIFNRWHLIFGLFRSIMDILDKHCIEDFPHKMLYKYVYFSLKQNLQHYIMVYSLSEEQSQMLHQKMQLYKNQLQHMATKTQEENVVQLKKEQKQMRDYFKKLKLALDP